MKYLLLLLLLMTQLFAYEKNKPITIYGYVSEQVIHTSLHNQKENHYIFNSNYMDGAFIKEKSFQLSLDKNVTDIIESWNSETHYPRFQRYKLEGTLLKEKNKDIKQENQNALKVSSKEQVFQVHSIEKIDAKIKAWSYLNNYRKVKLLVKSPMVDTIENSYMSDYIYGKQDVGYITNVKIKAENKLIYNVNTTPQLAEDPFFSFSYKDLKASTLTLEYTDNNGTIKTYHKKIRERNSTLERPHRIKRLENAKSYPNKIKSIEKLFGKITLIEDGIHLIAPKLAENGSSVPIAIRSNIKFKSIALFIGDKNNCRSDINVSEEATAYYILASQWFATPYSVADFRTRIKIQMGLSEVLVVLEAENGKFYTAKKEVQFSVAGFNMGG